MKMKKELEELLELQKERLKVAIALEKKEKFIYPETTEISKIIIKLYDKLEHPEANTNIDDLLK